MAGLIDVEKVCTEIDRFKGYLDEDMICRLKIAVKRLPTVEAIPITWLKKHKYSNIIDLWEKDCRLKNTKDILDELLSEHNFKSYSDYVEYAGKIASLSRDDRLDILLKEKENETN